MSDAAGGEIYTFLKDTGDTRLGQYDLFDRVINIRLDALNKNGTRETIILRSDWEPVHEAWSGADTVRFRKCVHKPSISLKYKQVARSSFVGVNLYVSNFVLFTADGNMLTAFSSDEYSVEQMQVVLGYFGQAADGEPTSWDEFMDITPRAGMDMLVCDTITAVFTSKLPPDLTLQITAACANMLAVPDGQDETLSFDELVSSGALAEVKSGEGGVLGLIEDSVLAYYNPKEWSGNPTGYTATGLVESARYKVSATERVRKMAFQPLTDASGNSVMPLFKDAVLPGMTVGQALTYTLDMLGLTDVQFKIVSDRIFFYMRSDLDDPDNAVGAFQDVYKDSVLETHYDGMLPAVYSIEVNATATIVCPFFAFIGPFQQFKFKNRYAVGSQVSYWLGGGDEYGGKDTFYALSVELSFSTVDEDNEMQLFCIVEGTEEHEND